MKISAFLLIVCEYLKGRNESNFKIIRNLGLLRYFCICWIENVIIKCVPLHTCCLNSLQRDKKIVISLTSFPARINTCYYTIKSLMIQTMRPDRIVVWLAEEQFPEHKLPYCFEMLTAKGLEIRYCQDLRSHKKYFYMLQEQKADELVITFDDDIIYNPLSVERAYKKHLQYPTAIVANETKIIGFKTNGDILPYSRWKKAPYGNNKPNIQNSVMSGSGCLYPYGIWPKEMFDVKLHRRLAPTADDLWITFCAIHYSIPIVCVDIPAHTYTNVNMSQNENLSKVNCLGTGNDDTILSMLDYYKDINIKLHIK